MNNGPGCAVIACMVFWAIVIAVIGHVLGG